jgi:hypothetical protein
MKDIDRAMKYFILFAIGSAVVLPVLGEVYANVSNGIAVALAAAWAVWAGVKFSSLTPRSAMLGITAYVFSSVVLSLVGYVIIHPAIKSWIENHSVYFSLSLEQLVKFWGTAFGLLLAAYVIYVVRLGFSKAFEKLRNNSRETASAIDNAFSEDEP